MLLSSVSQLECGMFLRFNQAFHKISILPANALQYDKIMREICIMNTLNSTNQGGLRAMVATPIAIEKLHDEKLWIIQAFSMEPSTVDAWESAVRSYIQSVSPSTDRFLVYDLTPIAKLGFTSYMRQRTTALAKDNGDATGCVAIILNLNPTIRYLFEPFLRFTGARLQPNLTVKLFGERQAAIDWVSETLKASAEGL